MNHLFGALLQLFRLNEAAVVLVNDGEGLLDIICALAGQTACLEERLVVEGVSSCYTHDNAIISKQAAHDSSDVLLIMFTETMSFHIINNNNGIMSPVKLLYINADTEAHLHSCQEPSSHQNQQGY